ncbi:hypothetical protein LTR37_008964 [Vermiconidia calcicola]|uniref:Uncharacterized protein n=1 Tax=Vermiconidia calcicola TaxID=1690605 RepID=A0ACC3NAP4_9PEZI|nr:hypothetical protein LTR37_008964 [Vermiconidia calcicola]
MELPAELQGQVQQFETRVEGLEGALKHFTELRHQIEATSSHIDLRSVFTKKTLNVVSYLVLAEYKDDSFKVKEDSRRCLEGLKWLEKAGVPPWRFHGDFGKVSRSFMQDFRSLVQEHGYDRAKESVEQVSLNARLSRNATKLWKPQDVRKAKDLINTAEGRPTEKRKGRSASHVTDPTRTAPVQHEQEGVHSSSLPSPDPSLPGAARDGDSIDSLDGAADDVSNASRNAATNDDSIVSRQDATNDHSIVAQQDVPDDDSNGSQEDAPDDDSNGSQEDTPDDDSNGSQEDAPDDDSIANPNATMDVASPEAGRRAPLPINAGFMDFGDDETALSALWHSNKGVDSDSNGDSDDEIAPSPTSFGQVANEEQGGSSILADLGPNVDHRPLKRKAMTPLATEGVGRSGTEETFRYKQYKRFKANRPAISNIAAALAASPSYQHHSRNSSASYAVDGYSHAHPLQQAYGAREPLHKRARSDILPSPLVGMQASRPATDGYTTASTAMKHAESDLTIQPPSYAAGAQRFLTEKENSSLHTASGALDCDRSVQDGNFQQVDHVRDAAPDRLGSVQQEKLGSKVQDSTRPELSTGQRKPMAGPASQGQPIRPDFSLEYAIYSMQDDRWVSSTALDTILDILNPNKSLWFITPGVGPISTSRPEKNRSPRIPGLRPSHTRMVIPMPHDQLHWTIAVVYRTEHYILLYDPLHSQRWIQRDRRALQEFTVFLNTLEGSAAEWDIRVESGSLLQTDSNSCGVLTAVFALHHMSVSPVPPNIIQPLWRQTFQALLKLKRVQDEKERDDESSVHRPDTIRMVQSNVLKSMHPDMAELVGDEVRSHQDLIWHADRYVQEFSRVQALLDRLAQSRRAVFEQAQDYSRKAREILLDNTTCSLPPCLGMGGESAQFPEEMLLKSVDRWIGTTRQQLVSQLQQAKTDRTRFIKEQRERYMKGLDALAELDTNPMWLHA